MTVTMATFMELLDTSISNVSLPHIAGGLGTSYDENTWILTSYPVANAVNPAYECVAQPGFGYAFMFVPVTQLAYSYLAKNKNNKGSSLTRRLLRHQARCKPVCLVNGVGAIEPVPELGRELRDRIRYHDAREVDAISSERACEPSDLG